MREGLVVRDTGVQNVLEIAPSARFTNCEIVLAGSRNHIRIGDGAILSGLRLQMLSHANRFEVGDHCRVTSSVIMKLTDGNSLRLGSGTSVGGCNFICGEGRSVIVGKDCMLAWGLEIRTTDSHEILDARSGERINPGEDIVIEDHVWVGAHATLLKGAHVARDSVVAMRAVVTGRFRKPGVVLGGLPARVLRSGVTWDRELLG